MKKNLTSTLDKKNRDLARQWHPTKNAPLMPRDVTVGSNKKVWWMCGKGHEWEAYIKNRDKQGDGCPYCSGRRATKAYCLQALDPKLARGWHPTKNAMLTPQDVTPRSGKKVWWICTRGHEWVASPCNRNKGVGCPYCSGRRASEENNLQAANPEFIREWHSKKNAPLSAKDVTPYSAKKVWWICGKGHEWEAVIHARHRNGCPYCSGRRVAKDNCLQTMNPRLAREWHPVKNAPLTPKDVTTSYSKKVWWLCGKGHEWQAVTSERQKLGTGCPFCSGHRATMKICVQTVSPWLARQWHPVKNAWRTPADVTSYSQRLVWWKCKNGHEHRETVCARFKRGGCPTCILEKKRLRLSSHATCRA